MIYKKKKMFYYINTINTIIKKYKKVDYDNEIESHKIYFDVFLSNSLETRLML